jgi:hypothetical protein
MPPWVPAAWGPAVRMSIAALGVGLGLQYALGVVAVVVQLLTGSGVDWGASLRAPLTVFLSMHGPVEGLGLWATGFGWLLVAFWVAGRRQRAAGSGGLGAGSLLALRAAVLYVIPVLILAIVLSPEVLPIDLTTGIAGAFADPSAYAGWQPWMTLPLGGLAALAAAFVSVTGAGAGAAIAGRLPPAISAGLAGAKSVVVWTVCGTAAVVTVGTFVDVVADGLDIRLAAAFLLTLLLAAVGWGGVDVGVAFTVFAMRFFAGDAAVVLGRRPVWVFVCVAVVAAAFLRGGIRAARTLGPAPRRETLTAGAAAGVLTAVVLLVGAAMSTGTAGSMAGPAFGLGLLWSAVAIVGSQMAGNASPAGADAPPPLAE